MRTIGFDWDGTLTNSVNHSVIATNLALQTLGRKSISLDTFRAKIGWGYEGYYKRLGLKPEETSEFSRLFEYHCGEQGEPELIPEAEELLKEYQEDIVIITNNHKGHLEELLLEKGISIPVLKAVFPQSKIDIMKDSRIQVYFGDTVQDARDAIGAKVTPVLIASEFTYSSKSQMYLYAMQNPEVTVVSGLNQTKKHFTQA